MKVKKDKLEQFVQNIENNTYSVDLNDFREKLFEAQNALFFIDDQLMFSQKERKEIGEAFHFTHSLVVELEKMFEHEVK